MLTGAFLILGVGGDHEVLSIANGLVCTYLIYFPKAQMIETLAQNVYQPFSFF